jgi:hypothetical protein
LHVAALFYAELRFAALVVTRTTELYAHHHPDYMSRARQAFERSNRSAPGTYQGYRR